MAFSVHQPRQVIVVVLLTSIFWFVFNTLIIISYQGNIDSNDRKSALLFRHENKKIHRGFDKQLGDANKGQEASVTRGNHKNGQELPEELDTINKEITEDKRDHGINVMRKGLKSDNKIISLNKQQLSRKKESKAIRKEPKMANKKQITAVKIQPRKHIENSKDAERIPTIPDVNARDPNGLGEGGRAVVFEGSEKKKEKEGYSKYAFNEYASQKISLVRSIPDTRSAGCDAKSYPVSDLPTTSVIICFHNEAWSTLLRTVHTVLLRSPPQLLQEIILIDDFSTFDHLKKPLEDYVAQLGKVRILRTTKREGLIRARLLGAKAAKAQVLTFLDAHCEANVNWLEPLLDRIRRDPTTVAVPVIDIISSSDFSYSGTPAEVIGGFSWDMQFNWHSLPFSVRNQRREASDPIRTPTMAGGLFSIDRKYFYDSGSYDEGMDVWGGENLEMSFRIWQCGGKLEIIPCSRVGHVFRSRFPYKFPGGYHEVTVNLARVVHVWMDDYKRYVFLKRPDLQQVSHGDLTPRLELRRRLRCKSFKWYLENIYPEQTIPDTDNVAFGEVRNPSSGFCLDTLARSIGDELGASRCHGMGGNQHFVLTKNNQLQAEQAGDSLCVEAVGTSLVLVSCDDGPKQWSVVEGKLRNRGGDCVQLKNGGVRNGGEDVVMAKCNSSSEQEWTFSQQKS